MFQHVGAILDVTKLVQAQEDQHQQLDALVRPSTMLNIVQKMIQDALHEERHATIKQLRAMESQAQKIEQVASNFVSQIQSSFA